MKEAKVKAKVSMWLIDKGYKVDVFNQFFKIVGGSLKVKYSWIFIMSKYKSVTAFL